MSQIRNSQAIRVLIANDCPMLCEGICTVLEQRVGIAVVGTAGDGRAALRLVRTQHPDILLLGAHLPDMRGIDVAQEVHRQWPAVNVLLLAGYDDSGHTRALPKRGIKGYIAKTASGSEIVAAIRAVAAGHQVSTADVAGRREGTEAEPLTAREREVLRLIVNGHHNSDIAEVLVVSVKTVEFHVRNVFGKLGVRSRAEATRRAMEECLVASIA